MVLFPENGINLSFGFFALWSSVKVPYPGLYAVQKAKKSKTRVINPLLSSLGVFHLPKCQTFCVK